MPLGQYFGIDGASFLALQSYHELELARQNPAHKLALIRPFDRHVAVAG